MQEREKEKGRVHTGALWPFNVPSNCKVLVLQTLREPVLVAVIILPFAIIQCEIFFKQLTSQKKTENQRKR